MKISVIMPCHNAEPWIAAALRSAAQQMFRPHEIIVIDDGSTDDSMAQVDKSGVPVRRLQVNVRNAAVARNAGIEAATGDWLAMLDADDVWYPQHLSRAVELVAKNRDVAFMSNHDWITLAGDPLPMPDRFVCKLAAPKTGMAAGDFHRIVTQGYAFGHCTVLYQRQRVLDVGMFDTTQKRRHDIDLWLRVIAGGTWTYDTVKGGGYRLETPGSISKELRECDYYELRALVKNLALSDSAPYRTYVARLARSFLSQAILEGTAEDLARLRTLAWPQFTSLDRFVYSWGSICPPAVRCAIKTRRALTGIGKRLMEKHVNR